MAPALEQLVDALVAIAAREILEQEKAGGAGDATRRLEVEFDAQSTPRESEKVYQR